MIMIMVKKTQKRKNQANIDSPGQTQRPIKLSNLANKKPRFPGFNWTSRTGNGQGHFRSVEVASTRLSSSTRMAELLKFSLIQATQTAFVGPQNFHDQFQYSPKL